MPLIKPASDLQRNIGSIYELCRETGEAVYITRNGEASLVVMDADAFDEQMDLQRRIYEREMRVHRELMTARDDAQAGRLVPFDEVRSDEVE